LQLRGTWRSGLLSTGYFVTLPWQKLPSNERLRVVATFFPLEGGTFEAEKDVTIRLLAEAQRHRPPFAPPPAGLIPPAPTGPPAGQEPPEEQADRPEDGANPADAQRPAEVQTALGFRREVGRDHDLGTAVAYQQRDQRNPLGDGHAPTCTTRTVRPGRPGPK